MLRIKRTAISNHKRAWLLCAVAILVAGVFVYKQTHQPKAVSGPIKTTNTESTDDKAKKTQSDNASQGQNKVASTSAVSSADLVAPYGSFVSNHKPGQNGSNSTVASQCTTTPGARCYIKLTQNDVVKTLPAQVAGADGTVFWQWTIESAGLTKGNWTVTAVATLNDQSKSTTDQMALEVQ